MVSLAAGLAGCGDPIVGETYLGTPAFQVRGPVVQRETRIPASHGTLSARVFWVGAPADAEEQPATLDGGLAEFSMTFFDPPPGEATTFTSGGGAGRLGLGIIVLYADRDEDSRFDPKQDLLLGASAQHLVVYASSAVRSEDPLFSLLGPLAPGFHLYEHDRESQCRFVAAESCAPEGRLVPAEETGAVTLTLWATPEAVIVPAPALDASASIWSAP